MNWDDPTERYRLIERVGVAEYNRLIKKHHEDSIVATVNGRAIWPVGTRFGQLFMVGGTDTAFRTLEEAKTFAATA